MSRFVQTPVLDYCLNPRHVIDEDKDIIVPCGKCKGCFLHKANVWQMRLTQETESVPNTIFFTLTYNNKYLPKLKLDDKYFDSRSGDWVYTYADFQENIRFNGIKDVPRNDKFYITSKTLVPIQNFKGDYLAYSSKRDIQLWLKLLRKWLVENLFNGDYERANSVRFGRNYEAKASLFRYYVISEYGPTTLRPHYHGLIFPSSYEVAEALVSCGLYTCWQMCDKALFQQYTHYCDGGASGYVSQYITSFSKLPNVYKENKDLRPFRLASKAPAIGYLLQDKKKILEGIEHETIEYSVPISRLGVTSVLVRPKDFMHRLFPKCYQYSTYDSFRISWIYGLLWKEVRRVGRLSPFVSRLFRSSMHVLDYNANLACYNFCVKFDSHPLVYCYYLEKYYYLREQRALKFFYQMQEYFMCRQDVVSLIRYYVNFFDFYEKNKLLWCDSSLTYFLDSVGLSECDTSFLGSLSFYTDPSINRKSYEDELDQITESMVKIPKFNEKFGFAPHIV